MANLKIAIIYTIVFAIICIANNATANETDVVITIDDTLYLISQQQKVKWTEARNECQKRNMKLLRLETKDKADKLNEAIKNRKLDYTYWTSGNNLKTNTEFIWDYGGPKFEYTSWEKGMPDNWRGTEHCVELGFRSLGKWNDNRCWKERRYICERDLQDAAANSQ